MMGMPHIGKSKEPWDYPIVNIILAARLQFQEKHWTIFPK